MKYAGCLLVLVVMIHLAGCRQQSSSHVVARVGESVLTLEDAKAHIDTTRGSVDHQLREYVSYWVSTELVYQEAKREGFDNSEQVQRQLEDVHRQLVNRTYLDKQIADDTAAADDQSLRQYYAAHASEFFIREDMIKLNVIAFNNRERASTFAASLTRGKPWSRAVENVVKDSSSSGTVVSSASGEFFTQHTLFPPELWKVAAALSVNEVTFPIKTPLGYYILQPVSILKQGAHAEFESVKDEVRQRLSQERRRNNYNNLLGTLRKRYAVEVFIDSDHSKDSSQTQTNE